MIENLILQNYKAYEDVSIPIKPLTIFLGANSVGKSSIIQMLMLLHQTAEEYRGTYTSAFKIYGEYVNVGSFDNLLRDKNVKYPLSMTICIANNELYELFKKCRLEFVNDFLGAGIMFPSSKYPSQLQKDIYTREGFLKYITEFISAVSKASKKDNQLQSYLQYRLDMHLDLSDHNSIGEIMRCYDFRDRLSKISKSEYEISFQLIVEDERLKIKKIRFSIPDSYVILDVEIKTDSNIKISSDFSLLPNDIAHIKNVINFNNTIFDVLDSSEEAPGSTLASSFICKIARLLISQLQDDFRGERINYVSPLRAHPKRYYMLDKAKMSISLDTLDGDAIAEVLKENRGVKRNVNEWFSKFGFKIDVSEFREVIHHMNVTQNGLSLDITDVGFGISQVLPIIIQGFLSDEDSLTIIEQPEIHLHPTMQADLGDLFIDIVESGDKRLVIETHSEYLLRRIRRRISEGKINKDDVAICLFHPKTKEKPAWVEILDIGEKGNFKWPEEFYGGELYNDTVEFLKNQ